MPKPQKAQIVLIKKFVNFLALECQNLNPNQPGYQKFKFYQRCIENVRGICYGLSVWHAMMHIPENTARGMPEWLDAAKEAIASWDERPESLNQHMILPNAERGAKSLREIFEQVINDVIYNFSYNIDLDLRHPVLMYLDQSRPEQHIRLLIPAKKNYLTDSVETTSDVQSESKLEADREFKIKQTAICGHFSEKDLFLNLEDEKTKASSTRVPLLISGSGHACSLRFDEKKNGWFFHDPNYDSTKSNVYRQEVFFSKTQDLVFEIKKILGPNLGVKVWDLIPSTQLPSDIKKEPEVFGPFNKKFAEDPTPFLLNGGIHKVLFQKPLCQTYRKKILAIISDKKKFPDEQTHYQDTSGNTLLSVAAWLNDTELMNVLLARGADKSVPNSAGYYSFTFAIIHNNLKYVNLLFIESFINERDTNGNTPLMWAVYYRAKEVQASLIAKGADLDFPNKNGFTPLMSAAAVHDVDTMEVLLDAKPNIDHQNKDGQTALMQAVVHYDSLQTSDPKNSKRLMQKAVSLLIEKGAELTLTDKNGHTALELAAIHGHFDVCKLLLSAAIYKSEEASSSESALRDGERKIPVQAYKEMLFRYAAAQNDHAFVDQCLAEGMDFHAADPAGHTAFDMAAARGHFEMCHKLFAFKKATEKESSSSTVEESKEKGDEEAESLKQSITKKMLCEECLQYLAERMNLHPDQSLWLAVAKKQGKKSLEWLLTNSPGIALTEQNHQGETALILAAAKGDGEAVGFLLEKAKDTPGLMHLETVQGETALTISARMGRMDIVKKLVESGADLSGIQGAKALMIAVQRHDLPLLHYLLIRGAQNLPINGSTPLHIASQTSFASARLILGYARPLKHLNAVDPPYGLTAMDHAAIRNDEDLFKLLKGKGADSQIGLPDVKLSRTMSESKKPPALSLKLALMQKNQKLSRFFLDKDGGIVSIKNPMMRKEDEKKLGTREMVFAEPQLKFVPPLLDEILREIGSLFKQVNKILIDKDNFYKNRGLLPDIFKKLGESNEVLIALFAMRPELAAQFNSVGQTPAQCLLGILKYEYGEMRRTFPEEIFENFTKRAVDGMCERLEIFVSSLIKIDRVMPTINLTTIPKNAPVFKKLRRGLVHGDDTSFIFNLFSGFSNDLGEREIKRNKIRQEYGLVLRSSTGQKQNQNTDSCEI